VQQLAGACIGVVPAHFLQPVMGLGDRFPVLVGEGVGFGLQRRMHDSIAGQHEINCSIGQ
jgi:hypothetical protein